MFKRGLACNWRVCVILLLALVMLGGMAPAVMATDNVGLVIDGERIDTSLPPVIKNNRTLVPVRLVSEKMGAVVDWNAENKTVHIVKGNRSVVLRIDNRLIDYTEDETSFSLCDVPPQIMDSRTFVPLRLVSNALGVTINWDQDSRTVYVDSQKLVNFTPFFDVTLATIHPGQVVTATTTLQVNFGSEKPAGATEIRFYRLDPNTGRGFVIARGSDISGTYNWLPDPANNGPCLVAAGIYNEQGDFLAGTVVPVELGVTPQVYLGGVASGQTVTDALSLQANLNFLAEYVEYEIKNNDTGSVIVTGETDPQGAYGWTPQWNDNGSVSIRAIAYDSEGQPYYSAPADVTVNVERKLALKGVSSGVIGEKPLTLWLSCNYPLSQVEYILKDQTTGEEILLFQFDGYSSYKWFPGPEQAGKWQVFARAKDSNGTTYTTEPAWVEIKGTPQLLLQAVGPEQVLTGTVKLKYLANIPLNTIEYHLTNQKNGSNMVIAEGSASEVEYSWTPEKKDEGYWNLQAVATTSGGDKITSESIPVQVYTGKIYTSKKPIVAKDKFLDFISPMATQSREKTGMSAALQAAQAILETGWGQSTPVDKYSGKMSYNMFGIKGSGSAGSVVANTWEEYNGITFRIDAKFRAYQKPTESWADHKSLLLTKSRYAPLREVMHDSTQGAWALRRCGYATDSKYPLKLIDIIKRYDLHLLDEVSI